MIGLRKVVQASLRNTTTNEGLRQPSRWSNEKQILLFKEKKTLLQLSNLDDVERSLHSEPMRYKRKFRQQGLENT